jgi:hypothetical protein
MDNESRLDPRLRRAVLEGIAAVAVAAAAYWLSCLLVWPAAANKGFGTQWELISSDPFAWRSQFPHRILAPLLAWIMGMGGPDYVRFVRGLHVVMLACVFLWARRLGTSRRDGALIALAVAVTAPVQMYKMHWVGYCDPLSYSLFFAGAMCVARTAVFWLLFLANLLTHELAVFLLPWLWFLRRQAGAPLGPDAAWAAGVGAAYGAFYLGVKAIAPEQVYSYEYFLDDPLLPWGAIAIWALALTHWFLAFGPVLAVLAWHQRVAAHGRERWQLWIVVAGIVAILGIAFDWMRHANLIVLPFVLASARFLIAGRRLAYAALLGASALFLWLHPPWDAGGEPTRTLWNRIVELVIAPQPKDFWRVVTDWIPAVWPSLLWVYALLAAVWLLGWWLARPAATAGPGGAAAPSCPARGPGSP